MRKVRFLILFVTMFPSLFAETHIQIEDPSTWTVQGLSAYIGQIVIFDQPMYITSNYSTYYISPRRIFYPTNQARPGTTEYYNIATLNNNAEMSISGISDYHRMGEKIYNLRAKVTGYSSLQMLGGEFRENSREDLERELPNIDINGEHRVLVCAMNLEYYLVNPVGDGMGPFDDYEHQKQRAKVSKALARINADLYGLVEVQACDESMQELADDLTKNTGRFFTAVTEGGNCSGTFTKAGIIYCTDVLEPASALQVINTGVSDRKKMMVFREKSTGEKFIFSINHFKAKSGQGMGSDADKGDGQSSFNGTRVKESEAILSKYSKFRLAIHEEDILMMGDLNAYGKEDPIITLIDGGMVDLHRTFHADSSYSYQFRDEFGYLDHALCNHTLLTQVTGMAAYHINSDENDYYTYDKSSDNTMFRSSDHDPILVGLALDSTKTRSETLTVGSYEVYQGEETIKILNAHQTKENSYYRLYTIDGRLLEQHPITSEEVSFASPASAGVYLVLIYDESRVHKFKIIVP